MATDIRRLPTMFLSHGSPMLAFAEAGEPYPEALARFSSSIDRPKAIIIMSGHWMTAGQARVTSSAEPELIYDFSGFPDELYSLTYPVKGDPALASRITEMLRSGGDDAALDNMRGLDHGVWIPLRFMYPEADIPVIQLSLPIAKDPREIMRMGRSLSALREEGVLLLASGGAVHNLRKLRWDQRAGHVDSWAQEFNDWLKTTLSSARIEELLAFETSAPHASTAHPTTDHFMPLFFTVGASRTGDRFYVIYDEIQYANLSLFSFALR